MALARALALLAAVLLSAASAGESFDWHLPPGFPAPRVPRSNAMSYAKVTLGALLFRDKRLSQDGTLACASCHRQELAYTDGRARALGAHGVALRRSAMSLGNVAYNLAYSWADPNVRTLEAQMRTPLTNPKEMGLSARGAPALRRLGADAAILARFEEAFPGTGRALSFKHLIEAIACYERTLISGRSAFDRYVFDDDRTALSPAAKRGLDLFYSARAGCAACHAGINFSGAVASVGARSGAALFANTGLYNLPGGRYPKDDRGLIEITHRARDEGKFRVPTLRNIALTAPYMHDGSLPTLAAVLDHYSEGTHRSAFRDPKVHALHLTKYEKEDLLAFLESLTDREFVSKSAN
ncbi:MAG TPA: cytochrome c peroxidase [Steroidobacteraceae bacterium]